MAEFTFAPLSPALFLERAAAAFPERTAVVDGDRRLTYADFATRCARLVSALADSGVEPGDRVAALCVNSHVLLELHHAVPARGAVLVPVNIRLAPDEIAWILEHSGARLLVATAELAETARDVANRLDLPLVVAGGPDDDYEAWLRSEGRPEDRVAVLGSGMGSPST